MLGVPDVGASHHTTTAAEPAPPSAAGPVSVTVGLSVNDVHFDLKITSDERRQVTDTAVVTGWRTAEWTDASLARSSDPTQAGGQTRRPLRLDEDIWMPDIRHLNTVSQTADNLLLMSSDTNSVVEPSGKVIFQSPVQLSVRFLPREGFNMFMIRLGSRLMTTAEMDLLPAGDSLDMGEYCGWYVNDTWMRRNETTRAGFAEPFSVIEAGIMPAII